MVAVLGESASSVEVDPVDDWLVEQIQFLVDERIHRVYQPQQRLWLRADCPWCRRLREMHKAEDINCPICIQLDRSQPDDDLGPVLHNRKPVYEPDHRTTATVRVVVDYIIKPTSRVKGQQHGVGAERAVWSTEISMQSPVPTSQETIAPFAVELANRFRVEMLDAPLRTMT